MIETYELTKTYTSRREGRVRALDGVTLTCREGEIYALLGLNGAGKTTALRILSTLIEPTAGEAYVDGFCVRKERRQVRRRIGVVSYDTRVYERMTPREIAVFFGRLGGLEERQIRRNLGEVAGLLGMEGFLDRRTEGLSTGMKQKTVILRALITGPAVLLFDEPTAGLDLWTARSVAGHLTALRERGKTVLFSTHNLAEAEKLADRVGILHRGRLVAEASPAELARRAGAADLEEAFFALLEPAPALAKTG